MILRTEQSSPSGSRSLTAVGKTRVEKYSEDMAWVRATHEDKDSDEVRGFLALRRLPRGAAKSEAANPCIGVSEKVDCKRILFSNKLSKRGWQFFFC